MSFEPVKVGYNEYGFNQTVKEYNEYKLNFQNIVNKIIALNLQNFNFETNDLTPLFKSPKTFFTSKLITEQINISGIVLNQNKIFDLMEIPEKLHDLIKEIENLIKRFYENEKNLNFYLYSDYFQIVNNIVEIKPEKLDFWKENYSIYLTNEKQVQVNNILTDISEKMQLLKELNFGFNYEDLLKKYLQANDGLKTVEIQYKELGNI